jgi:hypothetical protein
MSLRADMYPSESGRGQAERGASKKPIHETGSSLEFCFNLGRFCLTLFLFFDGGQARFSNESVGLRKMGKTGRSPFDTHTKSL